MFRWTTISMAAIVVLLATQCQTVTAGKITVDPNTPEAREQAEANAAGDLDPRLAKKIVYDAEHKPLKAIFSDLSAMTGVTLKAGYNVQDWQVRDRRMNVFVRGVTLAQLMNSIAHVMEFKWSINKDADPWTYRIFMDRKSLLSAQVELSKAEESYKRECAGRRKEFVDYIIGLKDLSPSEEDKLRDQNPYLYMLHQQGVDKALQGLFRDIPEFADGFIGLSQNFFPYLTELSPETRQSLMDAAKEQWKLREGRKGKPFPDEYEAEFEDGRARMCIEIVPRNESDWQRTEHRRWGGVGVFTRDGHWLDITHLRYPGDKLAQLRARMTLEATENGPHTDSAMLSALAAEWEASDAKQLDEIFPSEPIAEHPDEPALDAEVQLEVKEPKLSSILNALVRKCEFSVVSDSFSVTPGRAGVGGSSMSIRGILNAVQDGYRYNWHISGPVIELQSRDWFKKRTTQIPDEWVERWRADFKKAGFLPLDDFAQISFLTDDQIEENLMSDEVFSISSGWYGSDWLLLRNVLRLYASLDSTQRKAFFGPQGLHLDFLRPEQVQGLMDMLYPTSGPPDDIKGVDVWLNASLYREDDGQMHFHIMAYAAEKVVIKQIDYYLPQYREPKPKTPDGAPAARTQVQHLTAGK